MRPPLAAPLAPTGKPRRRATALDRARVRAWIARTEEGEDSHDAFWAVISDERTGMKRYRGSTERPPPIVLQKKLAALLERAAPELLTRAKDIANARLAELSDAAIECVTEVLSGNFSDARRARVRLDAARLTLAAVGIRENAPPQVQTNLMLTLGDGLRAMREVDVNGETIDAQATAVRDAESGDDGCA